MTLRQDSKVLSKNIIKKWLNAVANKFSLKNRWRKSQSKIVATKVTLRNITRLLATKKIRTRMCTTDLTLTNRNSRFRNGVLLRLRARSNSWTRHGSSQLRQTKKVRDKSKKKLAPFTLNRFSLRVYHKTTTKTARSFSHRLAIKIVQWRWDSQLIRLYPTRQVRRTIAVTTTASNGTQPGSPVYSSLRNWRSNNPCSQTTYLIWVPSPTR